MIKEYLEFCPGKGRADNDIETFMRSEYPCCEIDTSDYKTPGSARATYEVHIKRKNLKSVRAVLRNGKLYLIKENQQ